MGSLFKKLLNDIRFREGLKACMNCGVCTAICPAASFYNYDPRIIVDIVQSKNEGNIKELLKGEQIWYCGQCMSCKTRCPRGNTPAFIIMALRTISQEMGFFTESEKGRQQFAIKRTVGDNILKYGYCVYPETVSIEMHPEQGPIWEWALKNWKEVMQRFGANYQQEGPGIFRKISKETLNELDAIFEVTGGKKFYETIEKYSREKAKKMGLEFGEGTNNEYFEYTYSVTEKDHSR